MAQQILGSVEEPKNTETGENTSCLGHRHSHQQGVLASHPHVLDGGLDIKTLHHRPITERLQNYVMLGGERER